VTRRFAATLAASLTLLLSSLGASQEPAPAAPGGPVTTPVVSKAASPAGTDALKVEWVTVTAPDVGMMLAAVARPSGTGPFPAVVLLHGSHGFAREYVQLAEALARGGVVAVAPCWFTGGEGPGTKVVSAPIPCPDAPPISEPGGRLAVRTVSALVQAVRTLPDVQADSIGLFGHSRGSGATLAYLLGDSDPAVRAAVLENGGYPPDLSARAAQVKAAVLILHGGVFKANDGGSPLTKAEMARAFEAALKRAGKPVESTYYEYGGHNSLFSDAKQREDEVRRMVAFYTRHLRRTP
jgi:dienelactone hydrolase